MYAAVLQAQRAQQMVGAGLCLVFVETIHGAGQGKVLFDGQVVEEPQVFGQHPDAALQLNRAQPHIQTANLRFTARRRQQARQYLDCGGLARAVRSEERADGPRGHFEVQVVDGGEFPETPGEVAARDHESP